MEFYSKGRTLKALLSCPSDVYPPGEDSYLLLESLNHSLSAKPASVLDLCCGTGIAGIFAKKMFPGASVVCSDISTAALCTAKSNAGANGLELEFSRSDMFSSFKGKRFDLILCNPPYLPEDSKVLGANDLFNIDRGQLNKFLSGVYSHLGSKGSAYLVYSSLNPPSFSKHKNLDVRTMNSLSFFFEKLFLVRIKRKTR